MMYYYHFESFKSHSCRTIALISFTLVGLLAALPQHLLSLAVKTCGSEQYQMKESIKNHKDLGNLGFCNLHLNRIEDLVGGAFN